MFSQLTLEGYAVKPGHLAKQPRYITATTIKNHACLRYGLNQTILTRRNNVSGTLPNFGTRRIPHHRKRASKFLIWEGISERSVVQMLNYRITLRKEPEGGYTVTVPSLPGGITYGENVDDAIANAREAIELYREPKGAWRRCSNRRRNLRIHIGCQIKCLNSLLLLLGISSRFLRKKDMC